MALLSLPQIALLCQVARCHMNDKHEKVPSIQA